MNIPEKILNLIEYLEKKNNLSENELEYTVKNAGINVSDIDNYINFRHLLSESYGRKIIYESKKLEIVTMSWNVDDFTSIHDHGAAQWGLVLAFGAVQNTTFELKEGKIQMLDEQVLKKGEISVLNHTSIHQMGNPGFRPAVSLHIYYTQNPLNGVTAEARNFDLYEQKVYRATGGAFLQLPEESISSVEKCPSFDNDLYNKQLHIRRIFMDRCCPFTRLRENSTQTNAYYEQR